MVLAGLQVLVERWVFAPLLEQSAQLSEQLADLKNKHTVLRAQANPPKMRLDDIMLQLGDQSANHQRIVQIHQIADQHSVALRKASYQITAQTGGLAELKMQAELSGSYPAIRQFLRDVLAQDEALALTALELSRTTGHAGVRAQAGLTLFSHL